MKNLILPSIELQKGDQVEVTAVRFENHAHMVGKRGSIVRYVKSRKVFTVDFGDEYWDFSPSRIRAVVEVA